MIRLTQSIDYYIRKSLGYPPWRCNPRFLAVPNPYTLPEVLQFLDGLTTVPESLGIEGITHDGYTDDEYNDDDEKCGPTVPHESVGKSGRI